MTGGLLAVHAHPDDETLANGALLASWVGTGRPVTVVTCTRGERGEVLPPAPTRLEGDGPSLAEHRERELVDALAHLGVTGHAYLDRVGGPPTRFEDSGMVWTGAGRAGRTAEVPARAFVGVPVDVAGARLAAVLRRQRPDVVVGYEPGGGYGHPDHVHAHRVMHRAVELAADPATDLGAVSPGRPWHVPVLLWTVVEEPALRSAWTALASEDLPVGLTVPDVDGPVPSCAVGADLVDVRVPVAPVADRLLGALRAHVSQVQAVDLTGVAPGVAGRLALSNRVVQPVLAEETYRYAPDRPVGSVAWPAGVRPRVA